MRGDGQASVVVITYLSCRATVNASPSESVSGQPLRSAVERYSAVGGAGRRARPARAGRRGGRAGRTAHVLPRHDSAVGPRPHRRCRRGGRRNAGSVDQGSAAPRPLRGAVPVHDLAVPGHPEHGVRPAAPGVTQAQAHRGDDRAHAGRSRSRSLGPRGSIGAASRRAAVVPGAAAASAGGLLPGGYRGERRRGHRAAAGAAPGDGPRPSVPGAPRPARQDPGAAPRDRRGIPSMNCGIARELLLTADPAELEGSTGSPLADHLRTCPACRAAAEQLLTAHRALLDVLEAGQSADAADEVVYAAIRSAERRRRAARRVRVGLPLAAAAVLGGLLVLRHTPDFPMPPDTRNATAVPARFSVTAPPGRNVLVLQPPDTSSVIVVWFF